MKSEIFRNDTEIDLHYNISDSEPFSSARSIIQFPLDHDLSAHSVNNYFLPQVEYGFFGEKYGDFIVEFRDFFGPSAFHRLFVRDVIRKKKNFSILVTFLDPTLHPIKGIKIHVSKARKVDFLVNGLVCAQVHYKVTKMEYVDVIMESENK